MACLRRLRGDGPADRSAAQRAAAGQRARGRRCRGDPRRSGRGRPDPARAARDGEPQRSGGGHRLRAAERRGGGVRQLGAAAALPGRGPGRAGRVRDRQRRRRGHHRPRPLREPALNSTAEAEEAVDRLAAMLTDARRVVAFTGAGISTESGIPDFRSPGGVWTRYDPRDFTFAKYVRDPEVRRRAWSMRREFWAGNPQPNAAHRALAELETAGRLGGVITQNIDGLHQGAGSATVVEIHGTSREVMCIGAAPRMGTPEGCGWTGPTQWAFAEVDLGVEDPRCPRCDGIVKSATVSFGQNLFPGVIDTPWV